MKVLTVIAEIQHQERGQSSVRSQIESHILLKLSSLPRPHLNMINQVPTGDSWTCWYHLHEISIKMRVIWGIQQWNCFLWGSRCIVECCKNLKGVLVEEKKALSHGVKLGWKKLIKKGNEKIELWSLIKRNYSWKLIIVNNNLQILEETMLK